jgi:Mn-dependent DtxR family transcriptional regulator
MQIDDEKFAWRLLETLYELGRADIGATPPVLATWVEAPETDVQHMLRRLDAQGLVDSERCRLSMKGLVLAVSMHGACKLARQPQAA